MELKTKLSPRLLILAGLLLGASLLLFGALHADGTGAETADEKKETAAAVGEAEAAREWCAYLEAEAERLCASVAGVSRVTVVVTVSGGFERQYACDETVRNGERSTEVVTLGSGSGAHLCNVGVLTPKIAGIGVSCRGASDAGTKAELTALLAAAFGVGTNKICVAEAD